MFTRWPLPPCVNLREKRVPRVASAVFAMLVEASKMALALSMLLKFWIVPLIRMCVTR